MSHHFCDRNCLDPYLATSTPYEGEVPWQPELDKVQPPEHCDPLEIPRSVIVRSYKRRARLKNSRQKVYTLRLTMEERFGFGLKDVDIWQD